MGDAMAADPKGELVDFLVHQAFYPVLMAERRGPDKASIAQVQDATRAAIDRFRSYGSAQEVIDNFRRELSPNPARDIEPELKRLRLPVIEDIREDFERKAHELGFRVAI